MAILYKSLTQWYIDKMEGIVEGDFSDICVQSLIINVTGEYIPTGASCCAINNREHR